MNDKRIQSRLTEALATYTTSHGLGEGPISERERYAALVRDLHRPAHGKTVHGFERLLGRQDGHFLDRLSPTRTQIEGLRDEARAAADGGQVAICEAVLRDMTDGRIGTINTALVKQCAALVVASVDAGDLDLAAVCTLANMLRDVEASCARDCARALITAGDWIVEVVPERDGVTYKARHSDTTTADEAGSWSSSREVIDTLLRYAATAQGAA